MWHLDNEWWMRTRAYENENFLAFAHPNVAFIADPSGAIVGKLQSNIPGILVSELNLAQVTTDKHIRDRRPGLYGAITGP
jgi:predicted amidohydrolase